MSEQPTREQLREAAIVWTTQEWEYGEGPDLEYCRAFARAYLSQPQPSSGEKLYEACKAVVAWFDDGFPKATAMSDCRAAIAVYEAEQAAQKATGEK